VIEIRENAHGATEAFKLGQKRNVVAFFVGFILIKADELMQARPRYVRNKPPFHLRSAAWWLVIVIE